MNEPVISDLLKAHLKNVLIAFAEIEPTRADYEMVNEASLFLQSLDDEWRKVCQKTS